MGLDFAVEQVPDATTLLGFRHLLEEHKLGEKLFEAQNQMFEKQGWIMRGAASSTPRSSPHRHRRRTPPGTVIRRCIRPRRATSGTSA